MLDAIGLHHFRWRKKKVEQFIIPPTYFRKNPDYSIVEVKKQEDKKPSAPIENTVAEKSDLKINQPESINTSASTTVVNTPPPSAPKPNIQSTEPGISALSLSSIRAKKALEESAKGFVKETIHLPTEAFTETEMLLQWNKYAQRLGEKGFKIMEALLQINDPVLKGTTISLELPNEGSKLDFEKELSGLIGHLRGHLHNHDITIELSVNESITIRRNFNDQDRYNRLHELNPAIELLRSTFGLDLDV